MRLSTLLPYAATVFVAGLLSIGVAIFAVDTIERTTHSALNLALEEQGLGWSQVTVDGLQVQIAGTAPDEASRFRAISVAGRIVDAARVIDSMVVEDPKGLTPPQFNIEILRNDSGIALFGVIPAETDHEALLERIRQTARDLPVTDLLDIADFPAPNAWHNALDYGLEALDLLPQSKISITAQAVDVAALSESAAQKDTFESKLERARPSGIDGMIDISAPRPVLTPFTLRFVMDDEGARFDACSASSEAGRDRILAAAQEAGLEGEVDCTLGLGVPSPSWPKAAAQTIAAVAAIGGGTATMSDVDITLVAPQGTDEGLFDTVTGKLKEDLPRVFSLHAVLPEPVKVDGTDSPDGPPEFIVTRSPEGDVQLRGRVQDERTLTAAESFARAQFGVEGVHGAMRLDDTLPIGWSARILVAIQSMSYLHNGSVVAQPDYVAVRGVTGDEGAKAEISRILAETLGESANFEIDVEYQPKLDPAEHIPTPEECVAAINAILAGNKIIFAPGSTEVPNEARETLDAIAEQMTHCEDVAMEIGGHTDSQGRTEMNMNLSQARADSILNALLARRVLTSAMTAKGYGESVPIADNSTEEGREQNRRIEFKLILPEEPAAEETTEAATETPEDTPADETSQTESANE